MRSRRLWLLVLVMVLLTACAPGTNPELGTPAGDGVVAGFWLGLWHGIIAPVTFVVSLFTSEVNVYEVHNSGNWYNFGFMLGIGAFVGGGGATGRRGRR